MLTARHPFIPKPELSGGLLLFFLFLFKTGIPQTHHHEEEEGRDRFLSAGGSGIYGTGPGKAGINLRSYYNIGEAKLCFGPEFSIFQKTEHHGTSLRIMEIGLIGHYIVHMTPHVGIYPLGGPNLSIERFGAGHEGERIEYLWGVNAGGGVHLAFGHWAPYVEWKYVAGEAEQHVLSVGVLCNFL
jgi:hypothetical protein